MRRLALTALLTLGLLPGCVREVRPTPRLPDGSVSGAPIVAEQSTVDAEVFEEGPEVEPEPEPPSTVGAPIPGVPASGGTPITDAWGEDVSSSGASTVQEPVAKKRGKGKRKKKGKGAKATAGAPGMATSVANAADDFAARVKRVLGRASRLVGKRSLKTVTTRVTDNCTGFVEHVFAIAGVKVKGASDRMYEIAKELGALHQDDPQPGDLAFFVETYDRNRDGKRNDGVTHVAVVEKVNENGVVVFLHRGGKGVARARFSKEFPTQRLDENGAVLNDYLRPAKNGKRAYLAGELFVGYASIAAVLGQPEAWAETPVRLTRGRRSVGNTLP